MSLEIAGAWMTDPLAVAAENPPAGQGLPEDLGGLFQALFGEAVAVAPEREGEKEVPSQTPASPDLTEPNPSSPSPAVPPSACIELSAEVSTTAVDKPNSGSADDAALQGNGGRPAAGKLSPQDSEEGRRLDMVLLAWEGPRCRLGGWHSQDVAGDYAGRSMAEAAAMDATAPCLPDPPKQIQEVWRPQDLAVGYAGRPVAAATAPDAAGLQQPGLPPVGSGNRHPQDVARGRTEPRQAASLRMAEILQACGEKMRAEIFMPSVAPWLQHVKPPHPPTGMPTGVAAANDMQDPAVRIGPIPVTAPGAGGKTGAETPDADLGAWIQPGWPPVASGSTSVEAEAQSAWRILPICEAAACHTLAGAPAFQPLPAAPTSMPAATLPAGALPGAPAFPETDFISRIAQQMHVQVRDGKGVIRIQLEPAMLGRLEIKAESGAAGLLATIRTDTAAVKDYLEQNLHLLYRSLQDAGVKVDRILVLEDGWTQHAPGYNGYGQPRYSHESRRAPRQSLWQGADDRDAGEVPAAGVAPLLPLPPHSTFHAVA